MDFPPSIAEFPPTPTHHHRPEPMCQVKDDNVDVRPSQPCMVRGGDVMSGQDHVITEQAPQDLNELDVIITSATPRREAQEGEEEGTRAEVAEVTPRDVGDLYNVQDLECEEREEQRPSPKLLAHRFIASVTKELGPVRSSIEEVVSAISWVPQLPLGSPPPGRSPVMTISHSSGVNPPNTDAADAHEDSHCHFHPPNSRKDEFGRLCDFFESQLPSRLIAKVIREQSYPIVWYDRGDLSQSEALVTRAYVDMTSDLTDRLLSEFVNFDIATNNTESEGVKLPMEQDEDKQAVPCWWTAARDWTTSVIAHVGLGDMLLADPSRVQSARRVLANGLVRYLHLGYPDLFPLSETDSSAVSCCQRMKFQRFISQLDPFQLSILLPWGLSDLPWLDMKSPENANLKNNDFVHDEFLSNPNSAEGNEESHRRERAEGKPITIAEEDAFRLLFFDLKSQTAAILKKTVPFDAHLHLANAVKIALALLRSFGNLDSPLDGSNAREDRYEDEDDELQCQSLRNNQTHEKTISSNDVASLIATTLCLIPGVEFSDILTTLALLNRYRLPQWDHEEPFYSETFQLAGQSITAFTTFKDAVALLTSLIARVHHDHSECPQVSTSLTSHHPISPKPSKKPSNPFDVSSAFRSPPPVLPAPTSPDVMLSQSSAMARSNALLFSSAALYSSASEFGSDVSNDIERDEYGANHGRYIPKNNNEGYGKDQTNNQPWLDGGMERNPPDDSPFAPQDKLTAVSSSNFIPSAVCFRAVERHARSPINKRAVDIAESPSSSDEG